MGTMPPCQVCGLVGMHTADLPPAKLRRMLFSPQVEAWCDFTTGKPVGRMLVLRHLGNTRPKICGKVYEYSSLELSMAQGFSSVSEIDYGEGLA